MRSRLIPSSSPLYSSAVYDNFMYTLEETSKTQRLIETFLGNKEVKTIIIREQK
jgi:hypothetical protein